MKPALFAAFLLAVPSSAQSDRPSIILILADDLGCGDLGSCGQEKIKTPHLDRDIAEKTDLAGRHPDIVRRFDEFLATARTESPEWSIREAR